MSGQQKRENERYGLELPAKVTWRDTSGNIRETAGIIRDLSSSGAYIVCDSPIGKGCEIYVEIERSVKIAKTISSRVSARGKVVRDVMMSPPDTGHGYGVIFDHFSFARL